MLWEVDMGCAHESFQSGLGILGPLKGKEYTQIYRYHSWNLESFLGSLTCLSYFSILVIRYHNQDNLKKKDLLGGGLTEG